MGQRCYIDIAIYHVKRLDGKGHSMVNFSNCISNSKYKIKQSLNDSNHKKYNCSLYRYIRENGGFDNFEFKRLEYFASNNKYEALERVSMHRDNLKARLTMTIFPILDHESEVVCHHGFTNTKDNIVCRQCRHICEHDFNKYVCPVCVLRD